MRLGGHDPVKVYNAYKAAAEHTRAADGHPRPDHQGLRPRRGRRGQEHHAPAEEAERGRAARVPHALRHPDLRRRGRRSCRSTGRPTDSAGDAVHARAAQRRSAASCRARTVVAPAIKPDLVRGLRRVPTRAPRAARPRRRWSSCGCCRSCCATRRSASWSCRSCPTRRAPSAWRRCSARSASTRTSASSTSRSTWTRCSTTRKRTDGQILEEGITEAGSMSSFIAAGTAYATHGVNTIPFFIFYSMFGFQRVGDLIWAGGRLAHARLPARRHRRPHDARRRRAAAPGRQQPPARAAGARTCMSYDPAFAYEIAVIIQDGIRRMYGERREHLLLPDRDERAVRACRAMPEGAREGILKGLYKFARRAEPEGASSRRSCSAAARSCPRCSRRRRCSREVRRRRRRLERHQLQASCTATATRASAGTCCIRARRRACRTSTQCLKDAPGVLVAASDYVKALPRRRSTAGCRGRCAALGTDGFGRSEGRAGAARLLRGRRALRRRWPRSSALAREGQIDAKVVEAGDQGPAASTRRSANPAIS